MKKETFTGVGRRRFLKSSIALGALSTLPIRSEAAPAVAEANDREYWIQVLTRTAHPVLKALSERRLKAQMPVEAPHGNVAERRQFTYLEAMGRLLTGMAPWLGLAHKAARKVACAASTPSGRVWPFRRVPIRHRRTS